MEKNLYITKPPYSKQNLPVPWPFINLRLHCITITTGQSRLGHTDIYESEHNSNLNLFFYLTKYHFTSRSRQTIVQCLTIVFVFASNVFLSRL